MKKIWNKRGLALILCFVTILFVALVSTGCGKKKETPDVAEKITVDLNASELGTGAKKFTFTVINNTDVSVQTIHTDEETVGAALLKLGLVAGEESSYGLYVKTVKGVTADYEKDGTYWGFFINGEYASAGVDSTKIEEGTDYSFQICK